MVDNDRLKLYREVNNYDIKYVAKKIKCPKSLIREWEEGSKEIDEVSLEKICALYKIEKEDLYYKEENKIGVHLLIIAFIIVASTLTLFIHSDVVIVITNILVGINIYFSLRYITKRFNKDNIVPKSLFNVELLKEKKIRVYTYLIESSLVASLYILVTNIFRIFEYDMLVINIYLFASKSVNSLIIIIISYLLLLILTFIIELAFGEYIVKRGIEDGRK